MPTTTTAPSTTTIPLPSSTTLSSPSLPAPTTQALLAHLSTTPTLTSALASTLRDSLARNGWTDRVRHLALELLRSGQCSTYPELVEEVLRRAGEVRRDGGVRNLKSGVERNGGVDKGAGEVGQRTWDDVRVPRQSVQDGVEFLKGRLREVVEVVDGEEEEESE